jgi:hypothetical protein
MALRRPVFQSRVSEPLFRLMTEGVRLLSNDTARFATLAELIELRRRTVLLSLPRHDTAALRGHFETAPSDGPISVACDLSRAGADCLDKARKWLTTELTFEATLTDAVSALLFDYAVEQSATRLLRDMGLGTSPATVGADSDRDDPSNVVPIR